MQPLNAFAIRASFGGSIHFGLLSVAENSARSLILPQSAAVKNLEERRLRSVPSGLKL
jgi:hypothetical protein